jgi:hemolysin activation/secretion protein
MMGKGAMFGGGWRLVIALSLPLSVTALAQNSAPGAAAPAAAASGAPAGAAAQAGSKAPANTFDILEYDVEGNTRLTQLEIERAVYPHLGEKKTVKDVEAARKALETKYHDRGYLTVLVNIPEQKVAGGHVRLKVIEAPVGKLNIVGAHYYSEGVLRANVPELAVDKVPDFNEVQSELTVINRSADHHVTPILKASDTPGRVDVDLQVQDDLPLHGSVEVNDYYAINTTHLRTIGQLHYDNLFQRDQSISIQYQTAPQDQDNAIVYSLSYVIPFPSGRVLALYGVHSNSNVAAVGGINVIGNGDIVGARYIVPLPGNGPTFYHNLTAGIDYKNFKQDVTLAGADTSIDTPIEYMPLTLDYSVTWLGQSTPAAPGAAAKPFSNTTLDTTVTFTFSGIGSSNETFDQKRYSSNSTFLIVHPSLSRLQPLLWGWSIDGKLEGQWASEALISNEQFGAGGIDSVRGYDESERLGDEGMRESLELRTPPLLAGLSPRIEKSYLLCFGEAAQLRITNAEPGNPDFYHLLSTGVGWRFKARGLSVDLDAAHVFDEGAATGAGANRGLFRVNYGF